MGRAMLGLIADRASYSEYSGYEQVEKSDISTETQQTPSQKWSECLNVLLAAWKSSNIHDDESPNRKSLEHAMTWIHLLSKKYPSSPPTCIIPEPSGGIIVEQVTEKNGNQYIVELTFYNSGSAEITYYVNGKVKKLEPIQTRFEKQVDY